MDTAETTIYTRVFDIDNNSNDNDDQIYNMWVKLVHYKNYHGNEVNEGIAILMNNFIDILNLKVLQHQALEAQQ